MLCGTRNRGKGYVYSFNSRTRPSIFSPPQPFTHSRPSIYSPIHLLFPTLILYSKHFISLPLTHSFLLPLTYFTPFPTHSLSHSLTPSLTHSSTHSATHCFWHTIAGGTSSCIMAQSSTAIMHSFQGPSSTIFFFRTRNKKKDVPNYWQKRPLPALSLTPLWKNAFG